MSSSIASRASLVSADLATQNAFIARVRRAPDRSHASRTFATVAGESSVAMASSSASCSVMPSSIASR